MKEIKKHYETGILLCDALCNTVGTLNERNKKHYETGILLCDTLCNTVGTLNERNKETL